MVFSSDLSMCVIVVSVEAVGGGCFEKKMLHVKLILGKPFQAVTPRAFTSQRSMHNGQCILQFMYNMVKKKYAHKDRVHHTYLLVSLLHSIFLNDLLKSLLKMV